MSEPWSTLDLVVIDAEGNGGHPPEVVELAAVPVRGGIIGHPVSWLVRPTEPIAWQARNVHGITDGDVAGQPTFAEIAGDVRRELGDALPVGHNVKVDLGVTQRQLPAWEPAEAFDTLRMARARLDIASRGLGSLVGYFALDRDLPNGLRPHRAAYDALMTARLLVEFAECSGPEPWTVDQLREHGGIKVRPTVPSLFD